MNSRSLILFRFRATFSFLLLSSLAIPSVVRSSNHYTQKQLDVLAERVGKMYWIDNQNDRTVAFLSAPAVKAATFNPQPYESFEILELVGQKSRNPFYKIKLESGREGYIRPDQFLEELNLTIVSVDPKADEKQRAAMAEEDEQKRIAWIAKQPWSQAVKDAAINRQAVPGLNAAETKQVRGNPARVYTVRGPHRHSEEHWFYPNGDVLVFQNGLLYQLRRSEKNPQ